MLPLVDKPLIQYGVEESVRSGISNIIIVTGRGKSAIEDHFDVSFELDTPRAGARRTFSRLAISDLIDVVCAAEGSARAGSRRVRAGTGGAEPFAVVRRRRD
jgi:UTP--glucose-1-phosphate uridylyltransferase